MNNFDELRVDAGAAALAASFAAALAAEEAWNGQKEAGGP